MVTDKKDAPPAEPDQEGWDTVPELAPAHDFDEDPILMGVYVGSRHIDLDGRDQVIHDFATEEGPASAWGSMVLDRKLTGLQGRFVRIEFMGEGESSGKGKNPPKLFDVKHRAKP
jgi:hypothetical protein